MIPDYMRKVQTIIIGILPLMKKMTTGQHVRHIPLHRKIRFVFPFHGQMIKGEERSKPWIRIQIIHMMEPWKDMKSRL